MSTGFQSALLQTLSERGHIHQVTDEASLDKRALESRITAYIGFDATADSLHVGNLCSMMLLRRLQQAGHRPIVLMGGGTTKIGDPSGKDETRRLLTDEVIAGNIASIKSGISRILDFDDPETGAIIVNNAEWLDELQYIPLLRDVGRHFTINRMLTFDSVRLRLDREQPLTFLEFNYMILQAYDFTVLARNHGCCLQMGGSDQWGNIVNGVELGRRSAQMELFGLTTPLITTASGAKMGKTAAGAVWLNADKLSPYDYWQFWRNTEDADVGRFMRLFTDLPLDQIAEMESAVGAAINDAKKILATEATALVHGREAALAAEETARRTFEQGALGADLPTVEVPSAALADGLGLIAAFVTAGLSGTNGEARRLIRQGGAKVNDSPINDENALIGTSNVSSEGVVKLSAGKKRHALLKVI